MTVVSPGHVISTLSFDAFKDKTRSKSQTRIALIEPRRWRVAVIRAGHNCLLWADQPTS